MGAGPPGFDGVSEKSMPMPNMSMSPMLGWPVVCTPQPRWMSSASSNTPLEYVSDDTSHGTPAPSRTENQSAALFDASCDVSLAASALSSSRNDATSGMALTSASQ